MIFYLLSLGLPLMCARIYAASSMTEAHFDEAKFAQCLAYDLTDPNGVYIPAMTSAFFQDKRCGRDDFLYQNVLSNDINSIVYHAHHMASRESYTIKVISPRQKTFLQTVRKEECLLASLRHSAIPKHYCTFLGYDGNVGLVLEYIRGNDLFEIIYKRQAIPKLLTIIEQVSNALDFLHTNHIMHRDIKLENFLLDYNGNIKLIDFGNAEYASGDVAVGFVGTEGYMAPEIHSTMPYTHAVDWYSFGVVLFMIHFRNCSLIMNDPISWIPIICENAIARSRTRSEATLIYNLCDPDPTTRWGSIEVKDWIKNRTNNN